jgi:hypothetical protein
MLRNVLLRLLLLIGISYALTASGALNEQHQQSGLAHKGKDSTALSRDDAVREAVFRYQFEHNTSALQNKAGIYPIAC